MKKRIFDLCVAGAALVVLAPLMVAVALSVKVVMGGPVIFRQERWGRGRRKFKIYKFRTLTNERDADGAYLPDAQRMTGLGRFLRLSKIDELPQLFNVIKGDMSIVGPRPTQRDNSDKRGARKYEVNPGMTGLVQIMPQPVPTQQANRLNAAYAVLSKRRGSIRRDFAIIVQTPGAVILNNLHRRYDHAVPQAQRGLKPPRG